MRVGPCVIRSSEDCASHSNCVMPRGCWGQMVDASMSRNASDLLSAAYQLAIVGNTAVWLGAYRDLGAAVPYVGWSWVDGTNASNINCGAVGCGPWSPGLPKYVMGGETRVTLAPHSYRVVSPTKGTGDVDCLLAWVCSVGGTIDAKMALTFNVQKVLVYDSSPNVRRPTCEWDWVCPPGFGCMPGSPSKVCEYGYLSS
jgi:hypothetical protein